MGNLKIGKFYIRKSDILEKLGLDANEYVTFDFDNSGINITIITDEDYVGFVEYKNEHEYKRQPLDVKFGRN